MSRIVLATRRWPTKVLLSAAALAVGAGLAQAHLARRQVITELVAVLDTYGVSDRQPEVHRILEREPDPPYARLSAARALLSDALEADSAEGLSRFGQFPATHELAATALGQRPAAWQAFLLLGGSRYLERSLAQERDLITAAAEWEGPLEIADGMGPAQAEARQFLTMAYLELWSFLSPEKEERTRRWLSDSFRDRVTFDRTIGSWLAVASDLDEALDPLPDEVFVWSHVQMLLARQELWEYWGEAWARGQRALRRELELILDEGRARVAGGDLRRGRERLLRAATTAPPAAEWRDHFETAFTAIPAGLFSRDDAARLAGWLDWELDRCLYAECLLAATTTERLAGAIDDLSTAVEARVALVMNDLALAERLERRRGAEPAVDWAPYYIEKSEALLQRGNVDAARRALAAVAGEWREGPLYARARLTAARAGDTEPLAAAQREWELEQRTAWRPLDWRTRRAPVSGVPFVRLELAAERAAPGIVLELAEPGAGRPRRGGVVEVLFDGRSLGVAVLPDAGPLEVLVDVDPGLHTLDLRSVAGREPALGAARLLP